MNYYYSTNTERQTHQISPAELIRGYSQWVQEYVDKGWNAFLLTFMFQPMGGGNKAILKGMAAEVERVYSAFITRVVRKPNAECDKLNRPIMIAAPDGRVFKHKKRQRSTMGYTCTGFWSFPGTRD
jgi:hypothetical protein